MLLYACDALKNPLILENSDQKTIEGSQFWLSLDNAAKIFPAVMSKDNSTVLRFTAVMKEAVRIKPLMKALEETESRFPYFKVQLKRGFFWFYLEHIKHPVPVETDDNLLCRIFPKKRLLIRVLVFQNRLSVECSHILTDGTGAFEFLKSLLSLYTRHLDISLPPDFQFRKPGDEISEEEYEDGYNRYFKENIPPMIKRVKAFHLPWTLNPSPRFHVMKAFISIEDIKVKAKEKGVSITDYLVSVYLFALQEIYEDYASYKSHAKNKFLRVQVPVNLRNIFPSQTMRNFSLFVMPELDMRLGHYSFDEIVKTVYHQMRLETDEKLINKNIARNVGSEKKIYIRSIPLILKILILKLKFYSLGSSQYSGVITNLGKVKFPGEMMELIDHLVFTPPPPNKMLKVNCGVIGFRDKLILSFGNVTKSTELENRILQFIEKQGIDVKKEEFQ